MMKVLPISYATGIWTVTLKTWSALSLQRKRTSMTRSFAIFTLNTMYIFFLSQITNCRWRLVCSMLQTSPWDRLPLTIRWLKQEFQLEFDPNNVPPKHMPIQYGPVQPKKVSFGSYPPWNGGILGWAYPYVRPSVCPSVCLPVPLDMGSLFTRVRYEGIKLELWNFTHV